MLCLNLGCTTNYTCNGSTLSNVHIVGFLKWEPFGNDANGKGVLSANSTDNNGFYLNNRPSNNVLNLQIYNINANTYGLIQKQSHLMIIPYVSLSNYLIKIMFSIMY